MMQFIIEIERESMVEKCFYSETLELPNGFRELIFNSVRFDSAKEARKVLEFHCSLIKDNQ